MNRRFAWLVGLSLIANPAWSQEPKTETPRKETPAPTALPALVVAPVTDAFAAVAPTRPAFNAEVDFLVWWYNRNQIPSLMNTAVEKDTQFSGTLLDPNATTLYGTRQNDFGAVPGIRVGLGLALSESVDLELNGFLMQRVSASGVFSGENGKPFLTRPFYNAHDIVEAGYDTSSMSGISGGLAVDNSNRFFGYEVNAAIFTNVPDGAIHKLIVGFRQVTLSENLTVIEHVRANGPGFLAYFPTVDANGQLVNANFDPATQSIRIRDNFATRNHFYGPQAGAQFRWGSGALTADALFKVAVGVNVENIRVQGQTARLTNGVVTDVGPGGLLAVSTNSGIVTNNELTVVPEIGLKLNYELGRNVAVNFGYNLLYVSSMARPGNQIDRRINPQYVPSDVAYNPGTSGPIAPRGFFRDTDFFAQGINFGLVVSY